MFLNSKLGNFNRSNMTNASFKVDSKLTAILGENYRSTEYALKELVDNSWDADAENVWIILPEPLTKDPVTIQDDGSGMTEKEVKNEYLFIANSRTSRKGEYTIQKRRAVKGRKGIGKFSGLVVATIMEVTTIARGKKTILTIDKKVILNSNLDLEKIELPVNVEECPDCSSGTSITLSELNQNFHFPNPERLKQILVAEYGRTEGFNIYINGQKLDIEDIPGETIREEIIMPDIGKVTLKFTLADSKTPLKGSGIGIRVQGKLIGRPNYLGLENNEELPKKLLKRVIGEIEADGLKDDVTADWGAIFENSIAYQSILEQFRPRIEDAIRGKFKTEVNLQKARLKKSLNKKLEQLPEFKRAFAEKHIERILKKFFNESDDKIDTIISVVLDAFDKDFYWEVMYHIDQAKDSEISVFAEALSNFGLLELSLISSQAINRRKFLDYLETIASKDETLEQDMHKAIEKNLWVFGQKYSLMASNQTLKNIIAKYTDKEFKGERASKRPDLFLAQDYSKYLLVEFKRPSHTIKRDDENQAEKYRDDLVSELGISDIEIIVIGGKVDQKIDSRHVANNAKLITFNALIADSRHQIDWLLKEVEHGFIDF